MPTEVPSVLGPPSRVSRQTVAWCLLLAALACAVYARNVDDYFLADDFDLIASFYDKPAAYFVRLLFSNENGTIWDSLCINDPGACDDPAHHGYLRPLKMWLLAAELALWGPTAWAFHVTSTVVFAANVVLVFLILDLLLGRRRPLAVLGAGIVAVHPVFGEIVPFITAREETLVSAFLLGAILAFLRHRLLGRSSSAFAILFALALLVKESGITTLGYALAFDAVQLPWAGDWREELRSRLRVYLPVPPILAVYFLLRFVAFHNLVGGHGAGETNFLSLSAFVGFHRWFFTRFLFDPTMVDNHGLPLRAIAAAGLAGAAITLALGWKRVTARTRSLLLIVGPGWYLTSTAVAHGIYHSARHNMVGVIAVAMFGAVLAGAVLEAARLGRRSHQVVGIAGFVVACGLFWQPTREHSLQFEAASEEVARVREWIERRTAGLPDGSTVHLDNVPQLGAPPWYFGWGLQSALKKPFTAGDLANRCFVYNRINAELNLYAVEVPERFDLYVDVAREMRAASR